MMQRFGALAAQRRIGGCILGVTPAEDTLCSMAIGYARAEDEPAFDVPALTVSMTRSDQTAFGASFAGLYVAAAHYFDPGNPLV